MSIQNSTPVRGRTRLPAAAGAPARTGGDSGWMKSGGDARRLAEVERQRQQEAEERRKSGVYMPFRFWVPVGESREVVILDSDMGVSFYEHQLQNPRTGKWDIYETCPKEWEHCPICDGAGQQNGRPRDSYYVMMLTVVDLTPFTIKRGTPEERDIPFSRKLLPVKANEQGFFMRQFDRKGSLRGLHLLMARDTKDSPSIGRPEIVLGTEENPDFTGWHDEAAILASFGSAAVTDQQGRVIKPANADCSAFDYGLLFKKPSGEDLRRRYGGHAPAGSAEDTRRAWDDHASHGDQSQGVSTGGGTIGALRRGASAPSGQGSGQSTPNDLDDEIPF